MKLRYVMLCVVVFLAFLFRQELRTLSSFAQMYADLCFPVERYTGTCPSLSKLARVEYGKYEAAILNVATQLTDPRRLFEWAPVLLISFGVLYLARRFRRKNQAGEIEIDLDMDVFSFMD